MSFPRYPGETWTDHVATSRQLDAQQDRAKLERRRWVKSLPPALRRIIQARTLEDLCCFLAAASWEAKGDPWSKWGDTWSDVLRERPSWGYAPPISRDEDGDPCEPWLISWSPTHALWEQDGEYLIHPRDRNTDQHYGVTA